jgi:hypothetical protein
MGARDETGEPKAAVGGLSLDAYVVIASGSMSADDVDRARDAGKLSMKAPEKGAAYLEVGGVVVAEGALRKKHGKSAFVVTRTYQDSGEVRS